MQYQPKGGMCRVCKHVNRNCSNLKFEYMKPVLKTFQVQTMIGMEDVSIVKCDEFEKAY